MGALFLFRRPPSLSFQRFWSLKIATSLSLAPFLDFAHDFMLFHLYQFEVRHFHPRLPLLHSDWSLGSARATGTEVVSATRIQQQR
jgi:hypothetical protein